MSESAKHAIQLQINRIKSLPALPEASLQIIDAVNDPDVSIENLVDVLSLSPPIVARLLGLANSAYFGQSGQINDLKTAIVRVLGLQLVRSLALAITLNGQMDANKCKSFDTNFFWLHSLITAAAAQKLAAVNPWEGITRATVYTCGLLLNIGIMLTAYLVPQEFDEILASKPESYRQLGVEITNRLGLSHYQMSYFLLNKWQLSDFYQDLFRRFEDPDLIGGELRLVKLLQASQAMGCLILNDSIHDEHALELIAEMVALPLEAVSVVFDELNKSKGNVQQLATVLGSK